MARKPATKTAAAAAAKKKAPAKRRAAPAKATVAAKSVPAAKPVAAVEATAHVEPVKAPAPAAAPALSPVMQMAKVEFSSNAVAEDYKAMSKAAFDAYMKSGNLFAENFGALNREIMAFAQATLESNLETARALAAAGSFEEVVDLQTKHSQKSVDSFLAESAKLTEMSVEMANGTIEPLQSNLKVTVEKLWKPIAA